MSLTQKLFMVLALILFATPVVSLPCTESFHSSFFRPIGKISHAIKLTQNIVYRTLKQKF